MSSFNVIFLGTGVSTAIPNLQHVLAASNNPCPVCVDACQGMQSKNKRNNVSIGILFESENREKRCIVIDVGKTMRDACINWLPKVGVARVDAILLTHDHADAILGLDDVRDLQTSTPTKCVNPSTGEETTGFKVESGPLDVYLTEVTMNTVNKAFSYLTNIPQFLDKQQGILERRVALLDFKVIDADDSFEVHGMPIKAFEVYHGGTYVSLGFSIGSPGQFVYISDVKIMPDASMAYLKSLPKIKVLVTDMLDEEGIFSHMGLHEALALVAELCPEKVYFVGMACRLGLHSEIEARLAVIAPHCQLAYDGLLLEGFKFKPESSPK